MLRELWAVLWNGVFQLLWYACLAFGYPLIFFSGLALGYCSTEFKMTDMPVEVVRRIAKDDVRDESFKKFCFEPEYAVEISADTPIPEDRLPGIVNYIVTKKDFEGTELTVFIFQDGDRKYFPNEKLNSVVERLKREGSCPPE